MRILLSLGLLATGVGLTTLAVAAPQATSGPAATQSAPADAPREAPAYLPFEAHTAAMRDLAARYATHVRVQNIARSAGGRELTALELAAPGSTPPEERTALLVVGGIDAEHPLSSEIALGVARGLLAAASDPASPAATLLNEHVVYVVPRVNADGIEGFHQRVPLPTRRNARAVDDDRDGLLNEDGPSDLNGDGRISVIRAPDPRGEWMLDPDEPRLLRRADTSKGERGVYRILMEGNDSDADGDINEDPAGGVDLGRNWPHLFEPGVPEAGLFALSEPETRGLADYVLARPNIVAAIVFGRHDTVMKPPAGKDRDRTGRAFRDLHPDDHALYAFVSEKARALDEPGAVRGARPEGALYSWLYNQLGVPTFAVRIERHKPESPTPQAQPEGDAPEDPSAAAPPPATNPASAPAATASQPAPQDEARAADAAATSTRDRGKTPSKESKREVPEVQEILDAVARRVESSEANREWLKHSADHPGDVDFLEWTDFDHPTLGAVQLGGFGGFFHSTPADDSLAGIVARQVTFVTQMKDWLPRVEFGEPAVRKFGQGVWEIELRLRNPGVFPTHTAMARQVERPPIIVRPEVDAGRVIGGPRAARVGVLPGGGRSELLVWLVRGESGDRIAFRASNRTLGTVTTTVTLTEPSAGEVQP